MSVASNLSKDSKKGYNILLEAQFHYDSGDDFRKEYALNADYLNGNQWNEMVEVHKDGCTETMTEEEYIRRQGRVPITNNIFQRISRSILGVDGQSPKDVIAVARDRAEQSYGETASTLLQCCWQRNYMDISRSHSLLSFLQSSTAFNYINYGWRDGELDVDIERCSPRDMILDNGMRDFLMRDCRIIGRLHEYTIGHLIEEFAVTPADARALRKEYTECLDDAFIRDFGERFGSPRLNNIDFMKPNTYGNCRVIEVWRKETERVWHLVDTASGSCESCTDEQYQLEIIPENRRREEQAKLTGAAPSLIEAEEGYEGVWHYYFLTPTGKIIASGTTPFLHKSHPWAGLLFPMTDGVIRAIFSDLRPQQRAVNRALIIQDFMNAASAKGLLLAPEGAFEGQDMEQVAEEWTKFNGIVMYKPGPNGEKPEQVKASTLHDGNMAMLETMLKLIDDLAGTNAALQGKSEFAGMSGVLFAQQTQNASISLVNYFNHMDAFTLYTAKKTLKTMLQFYPIERIRKICGADAVVPDDIAEVEYDLSLSLSQKTMVYRQNAITPLMEFYRNKDLSLHQLCEIAPLEYADKILQVIDRDQEQMAMLQQQQQQLQQQPSSVPMPNDSGSMQNTDGYEEEDPAAQSYDLAAAQQEQALEYIDPRIQMQQPPAY